MHTKIAILLGFSLILLTSCLSDKGASGAESAIEAVSSTKPNQANAKQVAQAAQTTNNARPAKVTIKSDQSGSLRTETSSTSTTTHKSSQVKTNQPSEGATQAEMNAKRKAIAEAKANPPVAQKPKQKKPEFGPKLPSACSLISESDIAKIIGVEVGYIARKDGSGKSATQKSCFFRWDHDGIPNSGVLIQVQKNPLPEEFPEWAAYYVSAKKNQGDKAPDGSSTYRYKDFPGYGVAGAYSSELGRYYWRTKNDIVYMVALNMPEESDVQLGWAKALAKEVSSNAKI